MKQRSTIAAIIAVAAIVVGAVFAVEIPAAPAHAGWGSWSGTSPAFNGGTITSAILGPDGTNTNPAYSFSSDALNSRLGMWRIGSGRVGVGGGGVTMIDVDTSAKHLGVPGVLYTYGTVSNAGTGSCTSVSVAGSSSTPTITATCTAAQTVVLTLQSFGSGVTPRCTISPANAAAAAITTDAYMSASSATSATFTFPAVTAGAYIAHCEGTN